MEAYVFRCYLQWLVGQAKKQKTNSGQQELCWEDWFQVCQQPNFDQQWEDWELFSTREWRMPSHALYSPVCKIECFSYLQQRRCSPWRHNILKSKLSDMFHINVKHHNNPDPLMVFIIQFATGKTNHGVKLYGRVARHIDVKMCPVVSIAIYFTILRWQRKWTIQKSIFLTIWCGSVSNSSQTFVAMIKQRSWRTKHTLPPLIEPARCLLVFQWRAAWT